MSLIPPPLHPGDKVAIAATARKICPEEIAPAIQLFKSWGLQVVIPDGLFESNGQLAGTDEHRARLLQQMLDDDEVRAIFCARGGYGTVRIIDKLNWDHFAQHPKWIIGYSDVTVLHSHIQRHLGISTLHATMPINITSQVGITWEKNDALRTLFSTLTTQTYTLPLTGRIIQKSSYPIHLHGEIVGGNLSILYSLRGTPSDIDTDGKILLIEDLDEYLYHIDRMMQNLRLGRKLSNIKALIIGAMSDMHDNATPFGMSAHEIILDAVKDYDYPVFFTDMIGHVGLSNHAIPLGKPCTITAENNQNFVIEF